VVDYRISDREQTTRLAMMQIERLFWMPTQIRASVCLGAVLFPLLLGTLLVFPTIDDAWLALLVREEGVSSVRTALSNRPLAAQIFMWSYRSPQIYEAIGVATSAVLWIALGLEAGWLWRWLFPEWRQYWPVVSCLSICPIVVSTQLTTLTVLIPVNLPVVLTYGCLILIMRHAISTSSRHRSAIIASGLAAVFIASVLSEFTVAPLTASVALLIGQLSETREKSQRRKLWIGIACMVAVAVTGLFVFAATVNPNARPDANPRGMVYSIVADPFGFGLDALSALFRSLIGAYAATLSRVRLTWGENSTLAGVGFGIVMSALLLWACRSSQPTQENSQPRLNRKLFWVAIAFVAAMIGEFVRRAVSYTAGPSVPEPLSTRLFLPALPLAVCLTTALLLAVVRPRFQSAPVLLLGFLAGHSVAWQVTTYWRNEKVIASLADILWPYVVSENGNIVAILPEYLGREYEQTYKVSRSWPVDQGRKLWVAWEGRYETQFKRVGERSGPCATVRDLENPPPGIHRSTPIKTVLWVVPRKNGTFNVEPYCLAPAVPSNGNLPSRVRTGTAEPIRTF
jgi:hypothetical protein